MLTIAYGFDSFVDALLLDESMKDLDPNALHVFGDYYYCVVWSIIVKQYGYSDGTVYSGNYDFYCQMCRTGGTY